MAKELEMPVYPGSFLPFSYYEGLVQALRKLKIASFHTHNDIEVGELPRDAVERDLTALYKEEGIKWRRDRLQSGQPVFEVYMLHDCDSGPSETVYMCEYERKMGVKSTTSIFNRVLKNGVLLDYEIDHDVLVPLQKTGHCFTYHCNAAETVNYDVAHIASRFNEDVRQLRAKGYSIKHFSPHGGVRGKGNLNNNSFFYPSLIEERLFWTHNRFAPSGLRYSDGGFAPRLLRGDASTDLKSFLLSVSSWHNRLFMLIHPQYYFADSRAKLAEIFEASPWVKSYWDLHDRGHGHNYWDDVIDHLDSVSTPHSPVRRLMGGSGD